MTLASAIAIAVIGVGLVTVLFVRFRLLSTCRDCNGWFTPILREPVACSTCDSTGVVGRQAVATKRSRERAPEQAAEIYG